MIKLSIGFAAALALTASAAQACDFHEQHVMASAAPVEQPATAQAPAPLTPLPLVIEQAKADIATTEKCPDGATECAPVNQ